MISGRKRPPERSAPENTTSRAERVAGRLMQIKRAGRPLFRLRLGAAKHGGYADL
jgi:hypothetical protein